MSEQKLDGVLLQKLKIESGESKAGKSWKKQEFVIETTEQFPKKVCIGLFGDKLSLLDDINEGDNLSVSYNLESRDFNGKWYHNISAWKIEKTANKGTLPKSEEPIEEIKEDLPF